MNVCYTQHSCMALYDRPTLPSSTRQSSGGCAGRLGRLGCLRRPNPTLPSPLVSLCPQAPAPGSRTPWAGRVYVPCARISVGASIDRAARACRARAGGPRGPLGAAGCAAGSSDRLSRAAGRQAQRDTPCLGVLRAARRPPARAAYEAAWHSTCGTGAGPPRCAQRAACRAAALPVRGAPATLRMVRPRRHASVRRDRT